jgi:cell division protease FtsH
VDARRILTEKLDDLHILAKSLLEFETLSGEEIAGVLKGIKPVRDDTEALPPPAPASAVPLSTRTDPEPA